MMEFVDKLARLPWEKAISSPPFMQSKRINYIHVYDSTLHKRHELDAPRSVNCTEKTPTRLLTWDMTVDIAKLFKTKVNSPRTRFL